MGLIPLDHGGATCQHVVGVKSWQMSTSHYDALERGAVKLGWKRTSGLEEKILGRGEVSVHQLMFIFACDSITSSRVHLVSTRFLFCFFGISNFAITHQSSCFFPPFEVRYVTCFAVTFCTLCSVRQDCSQVTTVSSIHLCNYLC